jgi:hypothetical protein
MSLDTRSSKTVRTRVAPGERASGGTGAPRAEG